MTIEDEMENEAVEPVELAEGVGSKVSTGWEHRPLEEVLKAARRENKEAIEEVVQRFGPLVITIARQYQWSGAPLDDLESAGVLGVLEAIKHFDPCKGNFQAYVRYWVRWEVQQCAFEHLGVTSSSFWKALPKIVRAQQELARDLERVPTEREIAQRTNLTEEEVQAILRWIESLEWTPPPEEEVPPPSPQERLEEHVPDPQAQEGLQEVLKQEAREVLWRVVAEVNHPVDKLLLKKHILEGQTMEDLAQCRGRKASALRQQKRRLLQRMKQKIEEAGWEVEELIEVLQDC